MLPFVSLEEASSIGPGVERDFETSLYNHTMYAVVVGNPSSMFLDLEGSLDGANWFRLGSIDSAAPALSQVTANRVVRYVRANLQSFSGGSSPTFTATIAST